MGKSLSRRGQETWKEVRKLTNAPVIDHGLSNHAEVADIFSEN